MIAPYISEFLPARVRGTFVSRTIGFLAVGYLLAGLVAPGPRTSGRSPNEHTSDTH